MAGRHSRYSVAETFRRGKDGGWKCTDCQAEFCALVAFVPRLTFTRAIGHMVTRHGRLPHGTGEIHQLRRPADWWSTATFFTTTNGTANDTSWTWR